MEKRTLGLSLVSKERRVAIAAIGGQTRWNLQGKVAPESRFFIKVNKTNSCWLWTGSSNGRYGRFWSGAANVLAHRWSFEFHNGHINHTLLVCHSCDVTKCVNPAHLWQGTHKQNSLDSVAKGRNYNLGRMKLTHCTRGHEFTAENSMPNGSTRRCRKCKTEYDRSRLPHRKLARMMKSKK